MVALAADELSAAAVTKYVAVGCTATPSKAMFTRLRNVSSNDRSKFWRRSACVSADEDESDEASSFSTSAAASVTISTW